MEAELLIHKIQSLHQSIQEEVNSQVEEINSIQGRIEFNHKR